MAILTDATVIPLGSRENMTQSIVLIPAKAEANKPGILCLQDVDDNAVVGEHYIWFDHAGLLRYHTEIPTDQNGSTAAIVATTTSTVTLDTAFDSGHYIAGSTATGAANAFSVGGTSTHDKVEIYHNNTHGYINSRKGDLYLSASGGDINFSSDNIVAAGSIAGTSLGLGAGEAQIGSLNSTQSMTIEQAGTAVITVTTADVDFAQDINMASGKGIVGASSLTITTTTAGSVLNLKLGDADDYMVLGTTSNEPYIATTGTCNLIIKPDADLELTPAGGDTTVTGTLGASGITSKGIVNTVAVADFTMAGASAVALSIGADYHRLSLGTADDSDSYLMFDGTDLTFWDSHTGTVTLSTLAGGSLSNPTISGDMTITEGKLTWGDAVDEVAGAWTFANVANNGITVVADSMTTGSAIQVNTDATLTSGHMFEAVCDDETNISQGGYFTGNDGTNDVFEVGKYGGVTIRGNDGSKVFTVTSGNLDLNDSIFEVDVNSNQANYITRAHSGAATAAVLTITDDTTGTNQNVLVIDQDNTGDYDCVSILNGGTGYGVTVDAEVAGAEGFEFVGATSGTGIAFLADGTTGSWVGAAGVGLIHATSDGALADPTASLIYSTYTGNAGGATQKGICAYFVDAGTASGGSYTVGILSASNNGLKISTNAGTTSTALACVGSTNQTTSMVKIGATGVGTWIGASNVGMLDICSTGSFAHVNASLCYIENTGVPQNDSRGHCLRIVDTGDAAAGTAGYAVYISAQDATVEALYVDDGKVLVDESIELGASCKVGTNASIGGTLAVTGAQTNTIGIQSAAVSHTATATGGTTGLIADGTSFVTSISPGATGVLTLPTPTIGNIVWIATGTTGVSLRSDDPTSVGINGGTGGASAESDLTASCLYRVVCQSSANWVSTKFTNAGLEAAGQVAAT